MRKIDDIVGDLSDSPSDFSPDRRCNSTALPVLAWRMLNAVAVGLSPVFSWATTVEQVIAATTIVAKGIGQRFLLIRSGSFLNS